MNGWRNSNDDLPLEGEKVLLCGAMGGLYIGKYKGEGRFTYWNEGYNTRWFEWWMEIPKLPVETDE